LTHYNKARLINIRRTTATATVMLGVMLFLIAVQTAASITPAANVYQLSPKNADPAPTIDGVIDTSWSSQNKSTMPITIGTESQLLQVYTSVFNDFIYFGMQFRVSTHSNNESFAIACSNAAPDSASVNDSVYSYSVAKIVRIDGRNWDWKITSNPRQLTNWTKGTSIESKVGFGVSNFSFYEMRFGRVLPRPEDSGGDVNWTRKQSYIIKIFYGTQYGIMAASNTPILGNWTTSTQKITLTIPAAPDDPTSPEIKAFELNMLAGKIALFVASGFALGLVGVFILRTKDRIRRI
jgi:hypothetical protein